MADLFSTDTLNLTVRDLRTPRTGMLDAYFRTVSLDNTEEIHFDIDNKPRRIAPFVSPLVAGKVVASRGFQTSTFKPAYVKDKRAFSPTRAVKRVMGESIGGDIGETLTGRMEKLVGEDLKDQLEMLTRRLEWMACQAMYDGKVTVAGEDYPSVLVDFGRDAGQTITLSGGARWGQAGVKPLDLLQDWSDNMVKLTGVGLTEVTMTVDVWKVFRADADVKTRLDRQRGNSTLQPDAIKRDTRMDMGWVDNFHIYVYSGWYVDPITNIEGSMLPPGTVIGAAGDDVEGVRHFGAIMDHDSLRAMPYYVKSWLEQDPSMRYLLMQSAPLPVPYRVNATMRATVL